MALWLPKPRRVTLTAGQATAAQPPCACNQVEIGNATPDDLRVYEDPNDEATYFVITAGYAKLLKLQHNMDPTFPAFYLKAIQAGVAVLIWG